MNNQLVAIPKTEYIRTAMAINTDTPCVFWTLFLNSPLPLSTLETKHEKTKKEDTKYIHEHKELPKNVQATHMSALYVFLAVTLRFYERFYY